MTWPTSACRARPARLRAQSPDGSPGRPGSIRTRRQAVTRIGAAEERARYARLAATRCGAGSRRANGAPGRGRLGARRQRLRARLLPASTLAAAPRLLQRGGELLSWLDSSWPAVRRQLRERRASDRLTARPRSASGSAASGGGRPARPLASTAAWPRTAGLAVVAFLAPPPAFLDAVHQPAVARPASHAASRRPGACGGPPSCRPSGGSWKLPRRCRPS